MLYIKTKEYNFMQKLYQTCVISI